MKKEYVPQTLDLDPSSILRIPDDSGEEDIRQAYLKMIKAYPAGPGAGGI